MSTESNEQQPKDATPAPEPTPPTRPKAEAHEDEGPQPGNVAPPKHDDDGDEEDGPAPGNEKLPDDRPAAAQGAPGTGSAAKRRRRRKKKKDGPPGAPGDEAQAQPGAEGDARPHRPQVREVQPSGKKPPRKDRPPRDRERPAFNVGDVTFGKIVDIGEHALFIDLSGKALAIFDRAELDLPDEDPNAPEEPEPAEPAEEAKAEEAKAEEPTAEEAPPAEEAKAEEAASPAEETKAEERAPAAQEGEAQKVEAKPEKKEPAAPLPPVVLEDGAHFVGVVHNDGGRGGLVVLTRHPRRVSKAKGKAAQAFKDKATVLGLVTGVIKGGVEVDVDGLRAFAPGSHMDLRLGADLSGFVGKRLDFFVTQYAKRGRDVVLSRRPILEAEAKAFREVALSKLEVGSVVEGTVRSVVQFGAFIDIGDVEGLVPLMEMSHNRAEGPHDVFKVGEKVSVKIQKIDEKGKIWLSRKAAIPDPWGDVAKKYAQGTRHTGKVVRIQPFGAFVELESGVDGLIHTADLVFIPDAKAIPKRIEHPNELVKVGDEIEVVVSNLDAAGHRIGLHPALQGDAQGESPQKVIQYKQVKAVVTLIEQNGLHVRIRGTTGRNSRGYVTAAATGTPRGTELRKAFTVGQDIDAKIMEVDPKRSEVKLSIKALADQNERDAYQQYRQQVSREAKFTFGDLLAKKAGKPGN